MSFSCSQGLNKSEILYLTKSVFKEKKIVELCNTYHLLLFGLAQMKAPHRFLLNMHRVSEPVCEDTRELLVIIILITIYILLLNNVVVS